MPLSSLYQILLLIGVGWATYYPTLFAEISLVDDMQAITAIFNDDTLSLAGIFFPGSSGGGYYRPMIGVSYWLDKKLWFLEGGLMHFELVAAHLFNGLLVFWVMQELSWKYLRVKDTYAPLVAALLFLLHPIATESVNWISGRTDVMMANFILSSFYLLIKYKQNKKLYLLILSLICIVFGLLSKESAFGYLIVLPLFAAYNFKFSSFETECVFLNKNSIYLFLTYYLLAFFAALFFDLFWLVLFICVMYGAHVWKLKSERSGINIHGFVWSLLVSVSGTISLFFVVRRLAYRTDVDKIGMTIKLIFADVNYTISLFLGAIGFYSKKFIQPLPLNFFIIEVDPLYDFLGIAVLMLIFSWLLRRTLPSILILTGFSLLLPALPFAFGTIAWTAYAERYIYLSTAFWIMAGSLWLGKLILRQSSNVRSVLTAAVGTLILLCAGVTYARNMVWQNNVTLLADTVSKNQKNRMLRDIYMAALINSGKVEDAKLQYRIASSMQPVLYKNRYDDRADLIMGEQLCKEGRKDEALQLYVQALEKTKYGSESLLVAAFDLLNSMILDPVGDIELSRRKQLLEKLSDRLKVTTKNPARLIEFGKSADHSGAFQDAAMFFKMALENMPPNDPKKALVARMYNQALKHDENRYHAK